MNDQKPPLAVILDFDGTITLKDIGDVIITNFGRKGWQVASEAYARGELSLRELWAVEIAHLREEDHEEMRRRAAEVAEIRPGFRELVSYCRNNGIPLEVASSGIRFYIDAVLEDADVDLTVSAPDVAYDECGHGLVIFKDGLRDCGMTAMCKCERVWRHRREGRHVLFVGDGASDYCAALQADHVIARSSLARFCEQENQSFVPFDTFFEVQKVVAEIVSGRESGS